MSADNAVVGLAWYQFKYCALVSAAVPGGGCRNSAIDVQSNSSITTILISNLAPPAAAR